MDDAADTLDLIPLAIECFKIFSCCLLWQLRPIEIATNTISDAADSSSQMGFFSVWPCSARLALIIHQLYICVTYFILFVYEY